MVTPETCPHPDELCSECASGQRCHPVIPQKDGGLVQRKSAGLEKKGRLNSIQPKKHLPAWLVDASASVRRSYGF